jgi:hypothetical protein
VNINCTKWIHYDVSIHAAHVLWSNSFSHTLSDPFFFPFQEILMSFIILFLYMCKKYFDHIQPPIHPPADSHLKTVLVSYSCHSFPCVGGHVSIPQMTEDMQFFSVSVLLILLNMMISSSVHSLANDTMSLSKNPNNVLIQVFP